MHSDSMKKKLDSVRSTPIETSPPRSLLTSSMQDFYSRRPSADARIPPHLSMPNTHQLPLRGIAESPLYSAASSTTPSISFTRPISSQHSPTHSVDMDRSPRSKSRRKNSDGTSASFEFTGGEEVEIEETQGIKRLHIDDAYAAGQKRRAPASPPREDILDVNRRRGAAQRSPTSRVIATMASGPATTSPIASRANSYVSAASVTSLGATSNNAPSHPSPGHSPGGVSPTPSHSPYTTTVSINRSPKAASKTPTPNSGATSPRKMNEMSKPSGHKLQGFFMCECCPKKPKKFETSEELA